MPNVKTDADFESEFDLDTLERAQDIVSSPQRVKRAQRRADEKVQAAKDVRKRITRMSSGEGDSMSKGFRKLG